MKGSFSCLFCWGFFYAAEVAITFLAEIFILVCHKVLSKQELFILSLFQTIECKKKILKRILVL